MNKLTTADRVRIVACLVEGNSIRATVRMTGIAKNTIAKLLVDLGNACSKYQDETFRNLQCKRIQCDENGLFAARRRKTQRQRKRSRGAAMFGRGLHYALTQN
jgi:hypothetical protein